MRATVMTLLLCSFVSFLHATHNRAGEITYEQTGPSTIQATITTYIQTNSVADRDSLTLCWGDGTCQVLVRSNGNGDILENDYKVNHYSGIHTYTAFGSYTLSMTDPNRNNGILNINPPNSAEIQFHLQTTFTLRDLLLEGGSNRSPTLLIAPIDVGFVRQPFMHTPNAFDLDGDSIAYEIVTPLMDLNETVPNYIPIDQIGPGVENNYTFDEQTGLLIWDSPQIVGQYNIAIKIKSYRNGTLHEEMIRDMQILIKPEENTPPEINTNPEQSALITLKAGNPLAFDFAVHDSEDNPAEGEVFFRVSSGGIIQENSTVDWYPLIAALSGRFTWTPNLTDIRTMPYQIVFKATDSQGLATFRVFQVQVVENSTSIPLTFQQLGFQLFPNPATTQTQLKIPDNQLNKAATITIFDNLGRLVQQQQIDKTQAIETLNIGALQSGQYSIRFQTASTTVSTLLIIH